MLIMDWFFKKRYSFILFSSTLFECCLVVGLLYYVLVQNIASLLQFIPLIIAIVVHEVAHAYVANYFGDPTAKMCGRITLNPLAHVDPLGTVILPLFLIFSGSGFLFGWAKPVPVNIRYFKNPEKGMMFVALAGPLSNISLALISSWLLFLFTSFSVFSSVVINNYIDILLLNSIVINLILALFNMFPIPPLDGSRVLTYIAPQPLRNVLYRLEPYGLLIVVGAVYFDVFSTVLQSVIPIILNVIIIGF